MMPVRFAVHEGRKYFMGMVINFMTARNIFGAGCEKSLAQVRAHWPTLHLQKINYQEASNTRERNAGASISSINLYSPFPLKTRNTRVAGLSVNCATPAARIERVALVVYPLIVPDRLVMLYVYRYSGAI
jgi:hypothetical protein